MKAYNEYIDNISVSDTLHRQFVSCVTNASPSRRPIMIRRYATAFACLAVILLGVFAVPKLFQDNVTPITDLSQQPGTTGSDVTEPGSSEKHNNSLSSATIIDGSDYAQADSSYAAPSPGSCMYFIEVQKAMEKYAGTDTMLFLAIDIFPAEGKTEVTGEEIQAEADRLSALGYRVGYSKVWTYKGRGEKVPYTFLSGLFTVEELENFKASPDYGYAFRFAHNGDGSAVKVDMSVFESSSENLDLTAAYADPDLGAYLPEDLPSGFTFENATRVNTQAQNSLSALWIKGMGDIRWCISTLGEDDKARITSVADTWNYDLSLYPIPRADSVPDELREIVTDPIFRSEGLTLEAVQARAYEVSDAGDISGPCMRFGVLYGDILVELNVKGATPEAVFEMLQQIKE